MEFEWDPAKTASNRLKHGLSFETASRIFADPLRTEESQSIDGEVRWKTIGWVDPRILVVVYTLRGDEQQRVRLISARKANPYEEANYGQV